MAENIQVTQPIASKREALVAFRDGSKALVTSGIAGGKTDRITSVDTTYTYGPYKGSTVSMNFDFSQDNEHKPGKVSMEVSGNYPSAKVSGEHIAELLRNPAYLKVAAGSTYDLAQSGRELAARVEDTFGITSGPSIRKLAPASP